MRPIVATFLLLSPFSCFRPIAKVAGDGSGVVDVQWAGAAKGRLVASASALWCRSDSLVEVDAIQGDTAFGLALVAQDTLRPGQHPVVMPSVVVDWRPLARAALRFVGASETKGFEATGGNVHVTEVADNTVTGRIDVRMATENRRDTLRVTGSFTRIPLRPAPAVCGRIAKGKSG